MERTDAARRGIRPEIPDACAAQTFCEDPSLWAFMLQDQKQAAYPLQESSGMPEISLGTKGYGDA